MTVGSSISADRRASCRCGQLSVTCSGAPVRISVCHCLDCQRRSGSAFAVQARFPKDRVTAEGRSKSWASTGEGGATTIFHFCPECGSTVYYIGGGFPDLVAVAVGAFADPGFPPPRLSVWEERKHAWVEVRGDDVDHLE